MVPSAISRLSALALSLALSAPAFAQAPTESLASLAVNDYVVGPQDVLTITSYD